MFHLRLNLVTKTLFYIFVFFFTPGDVSDVTSKLIATHLNVEAKEIKAAPTTKGITINTAFHL